MRLLDRSASIPHLSDGQRLDDLEQALRAHVDQASNSLAAFIGEVDDRLEDLGVLLRRSTYIVDVPLNHRQTKVEGHDGGRNLGPSEQGQFITVRVEDLGWFGYELAGAQ